LALHRFLFFFFGPWPLVRLLTPVPMSFVSLFLFLLFDVCCSLGMSLLPFPQIPGIPSWENLTPSFIFLFCRRSLVAPTMLHPSHFSPISRALGILTQGNFFDFLTVMDSPPPFQEPLLETLSTRPQFSSRDFLFLWTFSSFPLFFFSPWSGPPCFASRVHLFFSTDCFFLTANPRTPRNSVVFLGPFVKAATGFFHGFRFSFIFHFFLFPFPFFPRMAQKVLFPNQNLPLIFGGLAFPPTLPARIRT